MSGSRLPRARRCVWLLLVLAPFSEPCSAQSSAEAPGGRKPGAVPARPPQAARSRPSGPAAVIAQAEQLAADARRQVERDPVAALEAARRALGLTEEFEPTAFVSMGRKGEVVEDAFQAAREGYARHRALLYEATGVALARRGQPLAASRYLGRAFLLQPTLERGLELGRVLNDLGRGREALDVVRRASESFARLDAPGAEVVARAADIAGLPSAQAEIDRGRLTALSGKAELREGPLLVPAGTKLSDAPRFRLEDAELTLVYAAEASCRSCSEDLEALGRLVPKGVRVVALPAGDDQDAALRQVMGIYRRPWPVLIGANLPAALRLEPRRALLVARGGWTLVVTPAPFGPDLSAAMAALQRSDVKEQVPRPQWNRRPPDRSPLPPPPALLSDGIAPGEDQPFPSEFDGAVQALRGGRPLEAAKLFDAVAARGDGWLLPPEARLDRALCLAAAGQRDGARRLLLRTGDSRFEDAIDRLLETVARTR